MYCHACLVDVTDGHIVAGVILCQPCYEQDDADAALARSDHGEDGPHGDYLNDYYSQFNGE